MLADHLLQDQVLRECELGGELEFLAMTHDQTARRYGVYCTHRTARVTDDWTEETMLG